MSQSDSSIKKFSPTPGYENVIAAGVMAVLVALAFLYWGITTGVQTSEAARLQETKLKELWFSPAGYLVGVKQDNWVVEVITWPEAGGAPSRLLEGNGLEQIVTRFSTERLQQQPSSVTSLLPPRYAVARDTSKIALVWGDYLIVKSLSSAGYTSTRRPPQAPVSALAFTDDNKLVALLDNGVLHFFDGDNLSLIANNGQGTGFNMPAGLWTFDSFVAVASFKDYAAKFFNTKLRDPYDSSYFTASGTERFSITDADAFALSISPAGSLAIAAGREKVTFAGEELRAPGNVRALAVYSEKSGTKSEKGVGISGASSNRILAAGDFEGVFLLSTEKGKEQERLASAPAGTRLLAFSPTHLAFADTNGGALLTLGKSRSINTAGWILIPIFFLYLIMALSELRSAAKERALVQKEKAEELVSIVPPEEVKVERAHLPLPEPPERLVQACAAGECVLYAGAGLGAQAGLPTWNPFMRGLVDWAAENRLVEDEFAQSMREALQFGLSDSVADSMINRLQNRKELLNDYLRETFLKAVPSAAHNELREIKFSAVLTANFDNLMEQTFAGREGRTYTHADTERLLETLTTNEFYTLKLYGTLERPETIIMAPAQYEDVIRGNLAFSRYMEALFISKTLFFIGSSLEGLEAYLKGITFSKQNLRTHYALVAVEGNAWRAKVEPLKTRYGIEVLPYSWSEGFGELQTFIKNLTARTKEIAPKDGQESSPVSPVSTRLKRLLLTNIGPFEELEVEFDARWNIMLGDNGVGKSTILKAIAIAICGPDAKPYAGRLIKSGHDKAVIVLETERNTYVTRLRRIDDDAAEIESAPSRAFETEGWLALGFPPLRVVSWARPKAAEVKLRRRPVVEDLLPLITGAPDTRPDSLKQWIVNLDYQIKDLISRGEVAIQQEALRDEFFEVITDLTHDFPIEFHEVGVTDQTYKVMIETEDGPLPIEALSQGMVSLIGWVGILLQRLHEIYGGSEDPKKRYALILMDELDAHLHPAWQRSLVRDIGEIFPNVQVIATTHSPLIVGGLLPEQVKRFAREEDGIVMYDVEEEMLVGRADQILTGDLFGLDTTFVMNKEMEKQMEEYNALLVKGRERTADEESRYQLLRQDLKERVPMPAETPPVRKAQELVEALLESEADGKHEGVIRIVRQKAEQLLMEVEKGRRKSS